MRAGMECEQHQVELSALLDGEIDARAIRAALDHVLDCPACARFYREARGLQAIVERCELPAGDVAGARPAGWLRPRPARWLRPGPAWAWAAAVVVAAVAGLWGASRWTNPPIHGATVGEGIHEIAGEIADAVEGEVPEDETAAIELGTKAAPMNEERFVSLTVELLRADPRYQQEMSDVLKQVARIRSEDGSDAL